MQSTSSITNTEILSNSISYLVKRSISLPGVPTIISIPVCTRWICFGIASPPTTNAVLKGKPFPSTLACSSTCMQSSLVGVNTITNGFFKFVTATASFLKFAQ
ncbi:hypothetical protein HanPI659440_Chr14g0564501 [Helianthus annuus]|nr:hypothetical protein HanPI659440_Chr14g0564501 [Helianthus annuus]